MLIRSTVIYSRNELRFQHIIFLFASALTAFRNPNELHPISLYFLFACTFCFLHFVPNPTSITNLISSHPHPPSLPPSLSTLSAPIPTPIPYLIQTKPKPLPNLLPHPQFHFREISEIRHSPHLCSHNRSGTSWRESWIRVLLPVGCGAACFSVDRKILANGSWWSGAGMAAGSTGDAPRPPTTPSLLTLRHWPTSG